MAGESEENQQVSALPRHHRRGLIEANLASIGSGRKKGLFRGITAAASLKPRPHRPLPVAVVLPLPRHHRRGLIEAGATMAEWDEDDCSSAASPPRPH